MTQANARQILLENLALLDNSIHWLERSYEMCIRIDEKPVYSEEEFDTFENLTSRFGRTVDIIVNKVFRSIDIMEMEEKGSLIDSVNRAEKRGLIETADDIRLLKDIRNEIVHEYKTLDLIRLFQLVLNKTPQLFRMNHSIREYCRKFEEGR